MKAQPTYKNDFEIYHAFQQMIIQMIHKTFCLEKNLLSQNPILEDDATNPSEKRLRKGLAQFCKIKKAESKIKQMEKEIEIGIKNINYQSRFMDLCRQFNLCNDEVIIFALEILLALDNTITEYVEIIDERRHLNPKEISFVLQILYGDDLHQKTKAREYFRYSAPLIKHGLIELHCSHRGENDFLRTDIELPSRIFQKLFSDVVDCENIATFSAITSPEVDFDQIVLAEDKKQQILDLVKNRREYLQKSKEWGFDQKITYGRGVIMLFHGESGTGKTMTAQGIANATGCTLMNVDVGKILNHSRNTFEENFQLIFQEAKLRNAIIFFDEAEELFCDRKMNLAMPFLLREFENIGSEICCILATNRPVILDQALERRILLRVEFPLPSAGLREKIWRNHIPKECPIDDIDFKALAEFNLSGGLIKNAVLLALNRAITRKDNQRICQEDLIYGARMQLQSQMERLVTTNSIPPKVSLEDVVLAPTTKNQVENFIDACKNRNRVFSEWGFGSKMNYGKAVTALFSGPTGVGKSICAEAVASELGIPLHIVSLPAIMSKYVGDTEKALQKVFADGNERVIFFDEADTFFATRLDGDSGGNSVNAHFINGQINFLLQEIERYNGIIILASNRPGAFDKSFERRIRYKITFHAPDADLRQELWRQMLSPTAPLSPDIDFKKLAERYEMNGGTIRNVLLRAAFRAATDGQIITQKILDESCQEEKPLDEKKRMGF